MKIIPYGATEGVTGSCFLIKHENLNLLIDCGLYQGEENNKNKNFPFNPADINYLILTHAHIDHAGRIPLLIKKGFKGKIICTRGTFDLAKIMLLDSARLMYEDYMINLRKAKRRGEDVEPPLYDENDVSKMHKLFCPIEYRQKYHLDTALAVTLKDAGHILGSAFIELECKTGVGIKRIIFSGDVGNKNKPIIEDPEYPDDADAVFVESTYGDREHKDFQTSKKEFEEAILFAFSQNGNVIIPTFALERAQEILYLIREMYDAKKLPSCRVFLDSPLAIAATNLFRKNTDYFDDEAVRIIRSGKDPFFFPYLTLTKNVEESKSINFYKERAIIIAGSGMCTGGRVLHHIKHNIWKENSCIVFIGYQARGTLGRDIIEGKKLINIYGESIAVRSHIFTINGFSSHADRKILIEWLSKMRSLKKVYLIHGDREVMEKLKESLSIELKKDIIIPKAGEPIEDV